MFKLYDAAMRLGPETSPIVIGFGVVGLALVGVHLAAPPGVPTAPTLTTLVAVLSAVTLVVGAVFRGLVFRSEAEPGARTLRATAIVVCLLAVGLGIRAGMDLQGGVQVSTTLIQPAPELGPGGRALKANLVNAKTVAPDRPHHPDDVTTPDRMSRFKRVRTFYTNTGSRGLRGPDFQTPSPGFRVVCIGDSVTFGWGVADEQTYPVHLASVLGVEVLNAGMPAAKPSQMAQWLQIHARTIDADIVVFSARPNWSMPRPFEDYRNAVMAAENAIAPAKLMIVLPPVSTFDPLGVREKDREVQGLRNVLGQRPFLELTGAFRAAQTTHGVVMETEGTLQRMVRLPGRTVVAEGHGEGDRLAPELVAAFESDLGLVEPMFFDGGHPDEQGYRLFATEVARSLRGMGWLPPQ
jgi:lysophospholipase L1-like esterase